MRSLILAALLLSSFGFAQTEKPILPPPPLSHKAPGKFAVIELEKLVNEVGDGQEAKAQLQAEFKKKQKMLDEKKAELDKLQKALQSSMSVMKEEAQQTKAAEFQQKVAEAQQMYGSMQQDMVKRQQEVMGDILKKAEPIIQDIAKKGDYDFVLNKTEAVVVWAKPELNITDTVIKRYNASYPGTKLPASKSKKK